MILAASGATVQLALLEIGPVLTVGIVVGFFAWRGKRGDFYKAAAEEAHDENKSLRDENAKLRSTRDLTPIIEKLDSFGENITKFGHQIERHMEATDRVFDKVADMNGALRHHAEAMTALADRLILDEAARALLATAAERKDRQ